MGLTLDDQNKIILDVNGNQFELVAGDIALMERLLSFSVGVDDQPLEVIRYAKELVVEAVGKDCFDAIFKNRKVTVSDLLQIVWYLIDAYKQHFGNLSAKYSVDNIKQPDEHIN